MMSAIVNSEFCHLGFSHVCTKKLHSFILTQLDDGSHLEICHVGFSHCHLGFRHLVIFSQIHSDNTLTALWLWLKLIQSDSNYSFWRWQPSWNCAILDSAILHKTLTQTNSIWLKLINSHSIWWFNLTQTHSFSLNLMMSAILNSAILDSTILNKKNFTHSFWLNLMITAILNSAM